MNPHEFIEPAAVVRARAHEAGFEVSAVQLANWHRAGLLLKPATRSLGRNHGTQSVYPAGTTAQLIKLCELHRTHRNMRVVGWRLWWDEYPVTDRWGRGYLDAVAKRFDRVIERMRHSHRILDGDDERAADQLSKEIDLLKSKRFPSSPASRMRRRTGREEFPTLITSVLAFVSGAMDTNLSGNAGMPNEGSEQESVFLKAMAFAPSSHAPAATQQLAAISHDVRPVLTNLSNAMGEGSCARVLARTPPPTLEWIRNGFRQCSLSVIAEPRRSQPAPNENALGPGAFPDIYEHAAPSELALMLILVCWIFARALPSGTPMSIESLQQLPQILHGANR